MDSQQKQRVSENKFPNTTMYSRKRYITPYSKDKRHYKPQILNCKHFLRFSQIDIDKFSKIIYGLSIF